MNIVSFNCNSARSKVDIIRALIDQFDVVCLQETFLSKDDSSFILGLRDNINYCISDCIQNISLNIGRPKGGLLIIWKSQLDKFITPVIINDNYQAIKIKSINGDVLLFNVYLPFDDNSVDQLTRYRDVVASLSHDIECNPGCKVTLIGDFNADPSRLRIWREITEFCKEYDLIVADLSLPNNSFTYLSPSHDTTSWLDHIVTSCPNEISNIMILHYLSLYDHFPISMKMEINFDPNVSSVEGVNPEYFVNWNKFHYNDYKFHKIMDSYFNSHASFNDLFNCGPGVCDNPHHKTLINYLYAHLTEGLLASSNHLTFKTKPKFKQIPGWNDSCKNLHSVARENFLLWKENGMPKFGSYYDNMKTSRSLFRSALSQCRENEKSIREEKIVTAFQNKDFRSFWRNIFAKNKSNCTTIDGTNDCQDIADLFASKYFKVLNDRTCQSKPKFFNELSEGIKDNVDEIFSIDPQIVEQHIHTLKVAIGNDNIHTNHLKYASKNCLLFISNLFNEMIKHVHLPAAMLLGEIRPILKNKFAKLNDSENYRPIMISSNILKLFEKCIQPYLNDNFHIHRNQFGFRAHTSTNMTVTVVKEIIHKYRDDHTNVFAGFIDLSKAFDKVNHFKLLKVVFESNLAPNLKLILKEYLLNQSSYVSYSSHESKYKSNLHHLGNGCRQGSIISPLIFNLYIDEMIRDVISTKIGCQLALTSYNILA